MDKRFAAGVVGRIIACIVIVALGLGVMTLLVSRREPPVQAEVKERAVLVEVVPAKKEDVAVQITGYGEVRSRDTVMIAPEVSGRVMEIHPRLETGEVIPQGETLFVIDQRDYKARYEESAASVDQSENAIARLRKQFQIDQSRLKTLERSLEIAQAEFARVKGLFEEDEVGTQSGVETAERAVNAAQDQLDQLQQLVELYPIRIREAEAALASARAMSNMAAANLERTEIVAPFDARVKHVDLEENMFVSPGASSITLADDSVLEISVPLDSREARQWLRFDDRTDSSKAWFTALVNVPVEIEWTEDTRGNRWKATLHRVEKFDQQTRTLTVVARVQAEDAVSDTSDHLPLVEGMFCKVLIPGQTAEDVVRLPAEAVGFDKDGTGFRTVYVAHENDKGELRLQTRKVVESHVEGEYVYVASGLEEGELVITTRLINPLENTLVEPEASLGDSVDVTMNAEGEGADS